MRNMTEETAKSPRISHVFREIMFDLDLQSSVSIFQTKRRFQKKKKKKVSTFGDRDIKIHTHTVQKQEKE